MCCWVSQHKAVSLLWESSERKNPSLLSSPPVHQAQDLPEEPPTADHVTRLSSGGGGRDTSPLSGTLAGAQCSGEGWARGRASIQSTLFCFFARCLLRPKKMLGLLIISVLNGLFKTGHVKVRGLDINHTDSSFPPVELVASRWYHHYRDFTFNHS